ncbi:hypothetical protein ACLBV5_09680 [Brevundimonas sp. M1A4_2e]
MAEPSLALATAVRSALTSANIFGIAATKPNEASKIMTRIPQGTKLPYLEIGDNQIVGRDDFGEAFECNVEVRAHAATTKELHVIAGAVYAALNRLLPVEGFVTHEVHYGGLLPMTETIGSTITETAVITFEYLIETRQ